ncbi:MAG: PIG-L deacetylase family protein [Flavobacteriales bacterium]
MLSNFNTVLVLAPHTDDGELGCGGLINKLCELGKQVVYVAFSICEESVPDTYDSKILGEEVKEATTILGIKPENLLIKNYKVRLFSDSRQEILEDMVGFNKTYRPDLVLCPSSYDVHQDHQIIHNEAKRAFKRTSIWAYDFIWNNFESKTTAFVSLSEEHTQAKIDSLKAYKSQGFRTYTSEKSIRTMLEYKGLQVGEERVEAFEIIRLKI